MKKKRDKRERERERDLSVAIGTGSLAPCHAMVASPALPACGSPPHTCIGNNRQSASLTHNHHDNTLTTYAWAHCRHTVTKSFCLCCSSVDISLRPLQTHTHARTHTHMHTYTRANLHMHARMRAHIHRHAHTDTRSILRLWGYILNDSSARVSDLPCSSGTK